MSLNRAKRGDEPLRVYCPLDVDFLIWHWKDKYDEKTALPPGMQKFLLKLLGGL